MAHAPMVIADMANLQLTWMTQFRVHFEHLFAKSQNGSLKANWNRLVEIEAFLKAFGLSIYLNTGVTFNDSNFVRPYRSDIGTINNNKMVLLHIYAICYCVYMKVCATLNLSAVEKVNDAEIEPLDG